MQKCECFVFLFILFLVSTQFVFSRCFCLPHTTVHYTNWWWWLYANGVAGDAQLMTIKMTMPASNFNSAWLRCVIVIVATPFPISYHLKSAAVKPVSSSGHVTQFLHLSSSGWWWLFILSDLLCTICVQAIYNVYYTYVNFTGHAFWTGCNEPS